MIVRRCSRSLRAAAGLLASALFVPGEAAAPGTEPTAVPRKRPVLVLSGGGARGAAHIGVLKVLEELRVPVDMVVGTSMGSIVGGLYATGWTPEEMETLLREIEWDRVFIDRVDRDEKPYRRRRDDSQYFVKAKIRFKGWKPYLATGILGGQRLELLLRSIEFKSTGESDFDDFPIPYRAVAADLTENEAVVLDHGHLATAMRASMSIAGAFPPVEFEGRLLVDGGAVANLPIGIAHGLGADTVIAVDITSPLGGEEELGSFLSIMSQMTSLLTTGNRVEDLKKLRPGDVLIRPELGDISFSDFPRAAEAIAIGEKAARALVEKLKPLSVSEEEWKAYKARHHRRPPGDLAVDRLEIRNESLVADDIVREYLPIPVGRRLDQEAFTEGVMRLYGLDYFGVMRPTFERREGEGVLSIVAPPKPYGRNSLQLGLGFYSDLHTESAATITARHLLLAANRRGGEWENVVQIGERMTLATEFYQPFGAGMKWFVVPAAHNLRTTQGIWTDGVRVADYRLLQYGASLDGGRTMGRWGDLRLGAFVNRSGGEVLTGPEIYPPFAETDGGVRVALAADTLDSSIFPRHGWRLRSEYSYSLEDFGADVPGGRVYGSALGAIGIGRYTVVPKVEYGDNWRSPVSLAGLFGLGGLWRLSGLGRNELLGERAALASIVAHRELLEVGLGALRTSVYVGGSVESGATYGEGDPFSLDTLQAGGSIFLGANTVIGPVYFALGFAESGRRRYYVSIGQAF